MISPFGLAIFAIFGLGMLGLPIGYSMIAGSILYLLLAGLDLGTSAEQILNGLYNSYVLLAVPLFLFSAELMNVSKMTDHLLRFCDMLVGRFRGGLGHINIAQSIIFAGMSGSAIADLAGTGRISIDMMTRNNRYPLSYAAAVTAASAVIGPIIPPSIPMVLYALISDTSVGYLFLGGVIPGVLMALAQMAINSYMAHKHDYPVEKPIPLREWPMITWVALPALLMPVILLGGIYGGVMTPTEAAAVAAAYAFVVAALWYRNITVRDTYVAVLNSSRATASIGMLIAGALIFNYVVTIEQIPNTVRGLLAGYELSPLMFLVAVNVILLVLGCLLEGSTIILVILPIFIPTAKALGIDLVHFGVVAVVNIMIGLITPPYGLLLFIISAISGAPLRAIIRDTMPFVWAMLVGARDHHVCPGHGALAAAAPRLQRIEFMKPIYILNGPNLNRLGKREPAIYGTATLADVERWCREEAGKHPVEFRQSNSEADIIGWIHEAIDQGSGIIINPAAFTFTSIAILDALKMFDGPIIELHITNIHKREAYYHHSYVSKVATAVIAGLGAEGYRVATASLLKMIKQKPV